MKKVLVLGGTRFFGRKLVELLVQDGHHVTILTRGQANNSIGKTVEHILVDRNDEQAFAQALEGRSFDLVYDNICYSPNEARAFCELFNGRIGKLIFTSTLSTYEADGKMHREADFDPYCYPIRMGGRADFTYGEGKRQAEAVFYKEAAFPVVAVRFPIVMGKDDYTKRLHFHIVRVLNGEPIGFTNMDAEMSFIQATEAASFLYWAGMTEIEGPINAAANGKVSLKELILLVEEATGKRANIALLGSEEIRSPYAIPASWYMTTEIAQQRGFQFTNLDEWLPQLVEEIVKNVAE